MTRQPSDIIDYTVAFWSQRTKQCVSHEDARQMVVNVVGFFQVLSEWARQAHQETIPSDPED